MSSSSCRDGGVAFVLICIPYRSRGCWLVVWNPSSRAFSLRRTAFARLWIARALVHSGVCAGDSCLGSCGRVCPLVGVAAPSCRAALPFDRDAHRPAVRVLAGGRRVALGGCGAQLFHCSAASAQSRGGSCKHGHAAGIRTGGARGEPAFGACHRPRAKRPSPGADRCTICMSSPAARCK